MHKFCLGQTVEYYPPCGLSASRDTCVVLAKLPERDGEPTALLYLTREVSTKTSNAASASFLVSAIQVSCSARLAFDCWLFGNLLSILAVLCTQQRWPRVLGHTSSIACPNPSARHRRPPAQADRKPASLQVEQEILPGLRTLAHVIN
jgi:hypothetical protein